MAKRIQASVTPNEAKKLIARAIAQMPEVRHALDNGILVLKGGTTISALAEEIASVQLVIHGRISQRGTTTTANHSVDPHIVSVEGGKVKTIRIENFDDVDEVAARMGRDDVLVTSANALDIHRKTALMVGRPLGSLAGRFLPSLMVKGVKIIIGIGWEKLIPNSIEEALQAAGNNRIDLATGTAVGLLPLTGTVVTETDAVTMLTGARTTVIGAGGIMGGEGSTTFVAEGEDSQLKKAWELIQSVKGAEMSGVPASLPECQPKNPTCTRFFTYGTCRMPAHYACTLRQPNLARKVFRS
ncbi:MAG: hypothetical protein V1691_04015 [Chloroflexota bacterium]